MVSPFMNNTSPCLGTVGSQEVHIQKPNCMSLPENHNFCKQKMLLSWTIPCWRFHCTNTHHWKVPCVSWCKNTNNLENGPPKKNPPKLSIHVNTRTEVPITITTVDSSPFVFKKIKCWPSYGWKHFSLGNKETIPCNYIWLKHSLIHKQCPCANTHLIFQEPWSQSTKKIKDDPFVRFKTIIYLDTHSLTQK